MLKWAVSDGVATLTFADPPGNRLGNELVQGFAAAVQELATRSDIRVALINAEGPDFSFGGDLNAWINLSEEEFRATISQALALTNTLEMLPFPVIVAVQGYCGGGGFEIALRADIILASDNAKFCHSEATIGAFTFLGGVQRVADRVGRTRAMQWAITAEQVDAQTALDAGLVNEVVPYSQLEATAQSWVERLKTGATLSHASHKQLLRAWADGGVAAADALMPEMAGKILHSEDCQNCLAAAAEAVRTGAPRPKFFFKGK